MTINIANHGFTIIWDSVYYFALSDYPNISDWELRKLILFSDYERKHNREIKIICENSKIIQAANHALANPALFLSAQKPSIITECTACKQKGCLTEFVCHTTPIENAKKILTSGKLLSAVKAFGKTADELVFDRNNSPFSVFNDPPDYYDYLMLSWGNCQAVDRIVMERILGRSPNEFDLSIDFQPGVRFYFKYDVIKNHKDFTNDGYHPAKIKNELSLTEYLYCCIIPENHRTKFKDIIPSFLANRVFYIENNCEDIWNWSEKVYNFVLGRGKPT